VTSVSSSEPFRPKRIGFLNELILIFCCHVLSTQFSLGYTVMKSVPVAVRSKSLVCSRLIPGIACSNPAESVDIHLLFVVCRVESGLCNGLTTRSEESCRACVCVCVKLFSVYKYKLQKRGDLGPIWTVAPPKKNIILCPMTSLYKN
jgi:hypothetical protein